MQDEHMDENDTLRTIVASLNLDNGGGYNHHRSSWATDSTLVDPVTSYTVIPSPGQTPQQTSIFSSLQSPIHAASRSTNTLVSPTGSVHRLAAMSTGRSTPSAGRRSAHFEGVSMASSSAVRALPEVEKDVDDPTTPVDSRASPHDAYQTPTALTKLLAAQMTTSPEASREHSYNAGYAGVISRCTYRPFIFSFVPLC